MSLEDLTPNTAPNRPGGQATAAEVEFSQRCTRLFRDHNRELLRLLRAKLRSWTDAKDVAQEAYVRIFQLDKAGAISHLRGLLFKTALNIATDRIRERARRMRDEHFVFFHAEQDNAPSAERLCIVDQDWKCLQNAVNELPPKCRQAFTLVEFDCREIADVAAQMGVKLNTIHQLLRRAYEHLAKASHAQRRMERRQA